MKLLYRFLDLKGVSYLMQKCIGFKIRNNRVKAHIKQGEYKDLCDSSDLVGGSDEVSGKNDEEWEKLPQYLK